MLLRVMTVVGVMFMGGIMLGDGLYHHNAFESAVGGILGSLSIAALGFISIENKR